MLGEKDIKSTSLRELAEKASAHSMEVARRWIALGYQVQKVLRVCNIAHCTYSTSVRLVRSKSVSTKEAFQCPGTPLRLEEERCPIG